MPKQSRGNMPKKPRGNMPQQPRGNMPKLPRDNMPNSLEAICLNSLTLWAVSKSLWRPMGRGPILPRGSPNVLANFGDFRCPYFLCIRGACWKFLKLHLTCSIYVVGVANYITTPGCRNIPNFRCCG
jgi:hypothetical protein